MKNNIIVSCTVNREIDDQLQAYCNKTGLPVSVVVRTAIAEYLNGKAQ